MALRPPFPFRQAQFAQVSLLKPAPFCTLFAGLGSTNKSATSLLFSYYLTLVLFSPPSPLLHISFYHKLFGRFGRNGLFSPAVLSGYNGSPDTRFSRGTTWLMSWPNGERYLRPPQSLVVSLVLSLASTLFFSCLKRTVSSKFFDTQVPSIATEELVLLRHARCVLFRLRCNGHSLLLSSYLSRIGRIENSAVLADTRPRTPLISFRIHQLRTLCGTRSLATLSHFTTFGPDPGEFSGFWGSMVFRHAPIPRKGSGNNNNNTTWPWKFIDPIFSQPMLCCFSSVTRSSVFHKQGVNLFILPLENIGRSLYCNIETYLSELMFRSHSTSSERPLLQIAPQAITETFHILLLAAVFLSQPLDYRAPIPILFRCWRIMQILTCQRKWHWSKMSQVSPLSHEPNLLCA